jgi:predicted RNA-binding Zn ribbon-like protein
MYLCEKRNNFMQPIALDPNSYEGTYKLVGEEISFDFINTISWRGTEKEHDWLDKPQNFITWALASGIINTRKAKGLKLQPDADLENQLGQVHTTRNDLYKILIPLAFDKKPNSELIKKMNTMINKISRYHHIDPRNYQWVWDEPFSFTEVLAPVIWNAAHIITDLDHSRVRHCPTCNWIFYDKTKNGSRKWCDMEDCGSRDKSLRYYHRKKD